ncbi:hypothetical protein [Mycobacterium palustre]|uniref:Uncharacterized protein n=1 Tax=Mycobacterium palustre TaxID=153971 RepID=A0A1X1ZVQ0_9MYCO|nr:hypothetical protein [Mycobacterium palustre]MCV7101543.1 hypothetical protein [Mycobacterium palustre]ORW28186.1 hypothetical protein AWC19_27510 [Mycobacterium palustre]
MTSGFGGQGYVQPSTRVLSAITETPNPDAEELASPEKTAAIIQTQGYQLKTLAGQVKQLQKGVNDATQNPIQQIQQFIADIVVLLGGGELADGALDFGDLKYILPALGALFGFGDGPFPLDLFAAAEKLFLGYVVPTKQFTDLINNMIGAWMDVFGIDPKFVKDTKALITATGELFGEVGNLLPSVNTFFTALDGAAGGGNAGTAMGPLGKALGAIVKLFASVDLKNFGSAVEFITAAIDPWIVQLTAIINFLNEVLAVLAFPGDVVNDPLPQLIVPFKNLIRFLGNVQFGIESFNPISAVQTWLGQLLLPLGNLSIVQPNLQLNPGFDDSTDLGDADDGKNWTRENLDPPVTDGDWVWDLIGQTAAGSATVHANGVDHGLLGNVVYVDEGHTFDFDAYVQWDELTAATGALALHIQTNDGTNVPIASVTSPGATGSWTHLSGSYTVPADVTSIRLRLYVGSGASAGQVWFDDVNIRRTNLIHQGLIQDLEDNLAQLFGFFQDLLTAAGAGDVVALGGDISSALSQAGSALTKIGDMLTNAVVSTPAELGALVKSAQDNAEAAGTNLQSILNNSEAADYAALGTLVKTAADNAGGALAELGSIITNSGQADAAALGTALSSAISGVTSALSQLGAIVTSSGQADANAVGTALAGALTNAANAIGQVSDIITNSLQADAAAVGTALSGAVSGLSDLVTHSGQPSPAATGTAIGTSQTNSQGVIDAIVQAAQNDAGLVNQAVNDAKTQLISFFSGLNAAFTGGDVSSPPAASASDAVLAAGTIQQRLATIGNGAEEQVDVDFSDYTNGALPNPPWTTTVGWTVTSGVLVGDSLLGAIDLYTGASLLTDYQEVSAVITALSGHGGLIARSTGSTGDVAMYVQYDTSNPGVWTFLGPSNTQLCEFSDTFTPGAEYALICGDSADGLPLNFQLLKDGVPLTVSSVSNGSGSGTATYTDSNSVTSIGGGYRTCGLYCGSGSSISITKFKARDTMASKPEVLVPNSEATSSTTYTDLATTSDEVAVTIGASGLAWVNVGALITTTGGAEGFISFSMSGANILAATDANAFATSASGVQASNTIPLSGLNPGLTLFKAKHRSSNGSSVTFANRRLSVLAL